MEQFDIISQLEDAATAKGWKFAFGLDRWSHNIAVQQEYELGELVLITDVRVQPTHVGVKYSSIKYTCLLMLGAKFDNDGLSSTLDETDLQKYDRRLKVLMQNLANFIGEFSCSNELDIAPYTIELGVNVFDPNMDFAITNATFDQ